MPTSFAFRTVALVALFAFAAGCLAAVAPAQDVAPAPQRTLVASGTGSVKPAPRDSNSNASIVAAVEKAEAKALPIAVADARSQAQELATATGVTLGTLVSVSNSGATNGFYGPIFYSNGSFGPGKYCGNVRSRSVTVDANGKRHLGKLKTRRVCRVPNTVQRVVWLTFAIG
ncbi:MAG TPA: SIMPL domain-containing protein [Baekduia sp.]|uniref:SIMPL domain-containing protein n=1 Tax=Baekduia sp. TaxID=2600305 RepID=UPI002BB7A641|nr:SIMPL domain-containing protein [Baekduia sp.]HMJ37022.1 SIMPL domain-containing protein [Baekduia sp.]